MKITFDRDVLIKELSIAQEVIATKTALTILSNILLIAKDEKLTILNLLHWYRGRSEFYGGEGILQGLEKYKEDIKNGLIEVGFDGEQEFIDNGFEL